MKSRRVSAGFNPSLEPEEFRDARELYARLLELGATPEGLRNYFVESSSDVFSHDNWLTKDAVQYLMKSRVDLNVLFDEDLVAVSSDAESLSQHVRKLQTVTLDPALIKQVLSTPSLSSILSLLDQFELATEDQLHDVVQQSAHKSRSLL